jgi:hypothetical protein
MLYRVCKSKDICSKLSYRANLTLYNLHTLAGLDVSARLHVLDCPAYQRLVRQSQQSVCLVTWPVS